MQHKLKSKLEIERLNMIICEYESIALHKDGQDKGIEALLKLG